jgi:hypothetical protein
MPSKAATKASPQPASMRTKSLPPSQDPADILNRQKKTLVDAIHEADHAELKRVQRLFDTPKENKAALEARFEIDRNNDQERIKHLMFDLKVLKEKTQNGELPRLLSARSYPSKGGNNDGIPKVNRFAGCEGESEAHFMKTMYARFDKLEDTARRRNLPKYSEAVENHKLKLLNAKREILHQLVAVQTSEINGRGYPANPSARHHAQYHHPRGHQSARFSDQTSTTSGESWATFATKNSSGVVTRRAAPKPPPVPVPRLKM